MENQIKVFREIRKQSKEMFASKFPNCFDANFIFGKYFFYLSSDFLEINSIHSLVNTLTIWENDQTIRQEFGITEEWEEENDFVLSMIEIMKFYFNGRDKFNFLFQNQNVLDIKIKCLENILNQKLAPIAKTFTK